MADEKSQELQRKIAEGLYKQNRDELVKSYKEMGSSSEDKIPASLREEDGRSALYSQATSILDKQLSRVAGIEFTRNDPNTDTVVVKFAISMFLIERTNLLRKLALESNSLSLFSLFASLRNRVLSMLDDQYYEKTLDEVVGDFLSVEPIVAACSELCGVPMPKTDEILDVYQRKLSDEIAKRTK